VGAAVNDFQGLERERYEDVGTIDAEDLLPSDWRFWSSSFKASCSIQAIQ
jgi:hypothetical protein